MNIPKAMIAKRAMRTDDVTNFVCLSMKLVEGAAEIAAETLLGGL